MRGHAANRVFPFREDSLFSLSAAVSDLSLDLITLTSHKMYLIPFLSQLQNEHLPFNLTLPRSSQAPPPLHLSSNPSLHRATLQDPRPAFMETHSATMALRMSHWGYDECSSRSI